MNVIDIGATDLDEPVSISISDSPKVNFGAGIELLMNDKNKPSNDGGKVDLGDLNDLEQELNDLSETATAAASSNNGSKTLSGMASDMFGLGGFTKAEESEPVNLNIEEPVNDANLGSATLGSMGTTKTWDGYSKMNEMPSVAPKTTMNEREKRRKKRAMLKKMDEWYEKGHVKQSTDLNMDSSFEEVEDEYETIMTKKERKTLLSCRDGGL